MNTYTGLAQVAVITIAISGIIGFLLFGLLGGMFSMLAFAIVFSFLALTAQKVPYKTERMEHSK